MSICNTLSNLFPPIIMAAEKERVCMIDIDKTYFSPHYKYIFASCPKVLVASSVMMSDKTRSEEDCNGDIMTGIGLSHETLPTLREGS